jgi:hypothetical protein
MTRHDNPYRFDLVNRGVGAVATATEGVEQDFTFEFTRQAAGKRRITDAAA